MENYRTHYIAIIGAGPAGISTAIQLHRYGMDYVLLEKDRVGGLLWNANWIENYPGFSGGISGPQLVARLEMHMRQLGVRVVQEKVIELDMKDDQFIIKVAKGNRVSQSVVIASGTKPKMPSLKLKGSVGEGKILTDVWPLLQMKRKQILIVGGGDAAFDYALNLGRKNAVTILNRGDRAKCIPLLLERVMNNPAIQHRTGITVRRAEVWGTANRLRVEVFSSMETEFLEADYLVFAIGRLPQLDFLSDKITQQRSTLVKHGRLQFIGDVHNGSYRQAAIAAGEGIKAAMMLCARSAEAP